MRGSLNSDAWRPLEDRKNSETTAAISYLWGARHRDDLARRDRAVGGSTLNETRYVLMDYFNPAAITDETGAVKERYAFSAFGVRSILNPDWTARTSSEGAFEFAFQGQFLDTESGLYNYGYRYYSPYLGRWTCKDPIGERGGTNLYCMISNRLLNSTDAFGLQPIPMPEPQPPASPTEITCLVIVTLKSAPCAKCSRTSVVGSGTEPITPKVTVNGVSSGGIEEARDKAAAKAELDASSRIPEGCEIVEVKDPNCSSRGMMV